MATDAIAVNAIVSADQLVLTAGQTPTVASTTPAGLPGDDAAASTTSQGGATGTIAIDPSVGGSSTPSSTDGGNSASINSPSNDGTASPVVGGDPSMNAGPGSNTPSNVDTGATGNNPVGSGSNADPTGANASNNPNQNSGTSGSSDDDDDSSSDDTLGLDRDKYEQLIPVRLRNLRDELRARIKADDKQIATLEPQVQQLQQTLTSEIAAEAKAQAAFDAALKAVQNCQTTIEDANKVIEESEARIQDGVAEPYDLENLAKFKQEKQDAEAALPGLMQAQDAARQNYDEIAAERIETDRSLTAAKTDLDFTRSDRVDAQVQLEAVQADIANAIKAAGGLMPPKP